MPRSAPGSDSLYRGLDAALVMIRSVIAIPWALTGSECPSRSIITLSTSSASSTARWVKPPAAIADQHQTQLKLGAGEVNLLALAPANVSGHVDLQAVSRDHLSSGSGDTRPKTAANPGPGESP